MSLIMIHDVEKSAFSKPARWEMGLLNPDDWQAGWISAPRVFDWNQRGARIQHTAKKAPPLHDDPSPLFRKEFRINGKIKSARVYISGLGYYELYLNGKRVGDHLLDPAFTDYSKRVLYVTYDITDMLREEDNAVGIMLGNGWYNMFTRAVWSFDRSPWRDDPTVICQMEMEYRDGRREIVGTDSSWRCAPGPVTFNSIRQGETYDATLEKKGWNTAGYEDKGWYDVRVVEGPKGTLTSQNLPPVKIVKEVAPEKVNRQGRERYVVDFGQNMAGFVKIKVKGERGRKIIIRYGERLDDRGGLDQHIISGYVREERFQTDIYVMKGEGVEEWHPRFTYHGFRYVEISGFPEVPDEKNLSACVAHTAFDTAGTFHCSSELLNKIQKNTLWSYVNNFHGYPTDCPHREKNGWLEDGALPCESGLFNFRSQQAYIKWVEDILDSQRPDGSIPPIVPTSGWGYQWNIGPAYDNALIIIPWNLYLYTGDTAQLSSFYPAMKKYFAYYRRQAREDILDLGLGDWCTARTQTPKRVTATAYYFFEAVLLSKIAAVVGEEQEAEEYARLAGEIRDTFLKRILRTEEDTLLTQTTLGCALYMGMTDSLTTAGSLRRLITLLEEDEMNLDFGNVGAKVVMNALSACGKAGIAYRMVNTTTYPGWGHWVSRGATTLWETWDGRLSRNHVMFGDVSAWMYKNLAGLSPDEDQPGFKRFTVHPLFPSDLDRVETEYHTLYGTIAVKWWREKEKLRMDITVPVNTTARVWLPAYRREEVLENGEPLSTP
jgi:alpha-L-rhamnosidase